jgi:hypothetical protein
MVGLLAMSKNTNRTLFNDFMGADPIGDGLIGFQKETRVYLLVFVGKELWKKIGEA